MIIGLEARPLTLDPRLASDADSAKISKLIHNGLFKINERNEAVPDLVEHFEVATPVKYIFHLRPGIVFSNGKELTAEDVRSTLISVLNPTFQSPLRGTLNQVETVRVIDPLTLEVILKEPFSPLLHALTIGIISSDGLNPFMGTGPFQVVKFNPSSELILEPNSHFSSSSPKIKKLVFQFIPDDNQRMMDLKKHRIDLVQNAIPMSFLKSIREDASLTVQDTEGVNVTYLGINLRHPALKKIEVRQAIAFALDIPAIINLYKPQLARPASSLLAPVHWAYDGSGEKHDYNPQKARDLLDKAGIPDPDGGGPLPRMTLNFRTSAKKERIGLARLMARSLKEIGIEVQIVPSEWGPLYQDINDGRFDLYSLTWVGVTEPDIFYHAFHSSQEPPQGANRGAYKNEIFDYLTESGRSTQKQSERKEIYATVQRLLAQDLPIIPLWYENNVAVFSKRVKGLRLRPDASFDWVVEVGKE